MNLAGTCVQERLGHLGNGSVLNLLQLSVFVTAFAWDLILQHRMHSPTNTSSMPTMKVLTVIVSMLVPRATSAPRPAAWTISAVPGCRTGCDLAWRFRGRPTSIFHILTQTFYILKIFTCWYLTALVCGRLHNIFQVKRGNGILCPRCVQNVWF